MIRLSGNIATTALVLATSAAQGIPITAVSELQMSHEWVINSGNSPTGITINNLSSTLMIDSAINSAVDDPGFTNSTSSSFQVGNPFTDPPVPSLGRRSDSTANLSNADFAVARYEYSVTSEDDPSEDDFDITSRAIEQVGFASAFIANDPVAASAFSSYVLGRSFRFNNTTDRAIDFNIAGLFEAYILASYDGEDGLARTSGGFEMLFDVGEGSSVQYFPVAPYLTTIEDDAPGATVSQLFLANSGGISGVSFGGSATAVGDGTDTSASLRAQNDYFFTVSLEGGASLLMETGFRQSNTVEYTPQIAMIPLPASLPLFAVGVFSIALVRRKRVGR